MAVLKSRGQAALSGAFGGARDFLDQWFRLNHQDKLQQQQNAYISAREEANRTAGQADKNAEDVRSGKYDVSDFGESMIPLLKARLGPTAGPSADERLSNVVPKVGADTTDAQINALLTAGKVKDSQENFPMELNGNGPMLPPQVQQMMDARDQAKAALQSTQDREVALAGNKSHATEKGRLAAVHEAAGPAAQDALNLETVTGPAKANTAGLTTAAQFDATHTPERLTAAATGAGLITGAQQDAENDPKRQKAAATGAGLKAGAVEAAQQPYKLALKREEQKLKEAGFESITSSTRTMMEGAKMMIPKIDDVAKMAQYMGQKNLFGPVASRLRDLAMKAGTIDEFDKLLGDDPISKDAVVGQFATELGLTASGVARVHGGARGGGSTGMLTYMRNLLTDSSSLKMFMGRLQGARAFMEDYAAGPKAEPRSHFDPVQYELENKDNQNPGNDPVLGSALDKLNKLKPQVQQ